MLGRLRLPIHDAIAHYVRLSEAVFSSTNVGRSSKSNAATLETELKAIVKDTFGNDDERMMDNGTNACKT